MDKKGEEQFRSFPKTFLKEGLNLSSSDVIELPLTQNKLGNGKFRNVTNQNEFYICAENMERPNERKPKLGNAIR